jgi:mono/diheme cytochrome c family protein
MRLSKTARRLRQLGAASALLWLAGGPALLRAQALPEGEGKELVAVACTQCHGLTPILQMRDGLGGWKNTVEEMVMRGAQLSPAEADTVVRYFLEHFGPASGPFQTGRLPHDSAISQSPVDAKDVALPEGPGKAAVERRCVMCHDIGRVVTVRRSRQEWERITKNMIERGPAATPEQVQEIVSYLSSQFGK